MKKTQQNTTSKQHRLQELLDHLQMNAKQFSETLGFSRADGIYHVLKFRNEISSNLANVIIEHYPNVSYDWLLKEEGKMLIDPLDKLEKAEFLEENANLNDVNNKYVVPLLPISAMGGTLVGFADNLDPYQTFQRLVSPIKGADWALTVTGESMSPEFPNGSVVLIKKINERAFIDWGKTFVLDTCNGVIIKKLMPSDDKGAVRCESINIDYPPFDVHFEDIYGVYRVLMCLSSK